jgi:hypothetical protein
MDVLARQRRREGVGLATIWWRAAVSLTALRAPAVETIPHHE